MRNELSDSHGVGSRRINISEHHARLFVNSATTIADFVLTVSERNKGRVMVEKENKNAAITR